MAIGITLIVGVVAVVVVYGLFYSASTSTSDSQIKTTKKELKEHDYRHVNFEKDIMASKNASKTSPKKAEKKGGVYKATKSNGDNSHLNNAIENMHLGLNDDQFFEHRVSTPKNNDSHNNSFNRENDNQHSSRDSYHGSHQGSSSSNSDSGSSNSSSWSSGSSGSSDSSYSSSDSSYSSSDSSSSSSFD